MTDMKARVLAVQDGGLLVRDCRTDQEVDVRTPHTFRFRPEDLVCITYDGIMTRSLPPQIRAAAIRRLPR